MNDKAICVNLKLLQITFETNAFVKISILNINFWFFFLNKNDIPEKNIKLRGCSVFLNQFFIFEKCLTILFKTPTMKKLSHDFRIYEWI